MGNDQKAIAPHSLIGQFPAYVKDSLQELKKVSFPTRQETIQATIVTMLLVLFFSLVVAVFDLIFGQLMKVIIS